jgi:hypothetical protein
LGVEIGDIIKFSAVGNDFFSVEKHTVQSMTDEEIDASDNLSRVIEANGSSKITEIN